MYKEYIPQPEGYPHAHCASFILYNETLYCVWYVYHQEEFQNARLCIATFNPLLKRWSEAKILFDGRGHSQGNPTLFTHNGKLFLLYVMLEGLYWNSAKLHLAEINTPELRPKYLWKYDLPEGTMVRHRPIVKGNEIIIPAYLEKEKKSILLHGFDPFHNLEVSGELDSGPIQGDLLMDSDKELTWILRGTGSQRKVVRAHSVDGGKTWPYVFPTPLECPLSGIAAHRDHDSNIFVAHNNTSEHKRSPLSLSVSKDNLKSLYKSMPLEFGEGEYSYPDLLGDIHGNVHMVYTHNREKIGHYFLSKETLDKLKE
jgi:predicted neuraminidase